MFYKFRDSAVAKFLAPQILPLSKKKKNQILDLNINIHYIHLNQSKFKPRIEFLFGQRE